MRMTIILTEEERRALMRLAERELRQPRDQVRLILRQELERQGKLKAVEAGEREYAGRERASVDRN